MMTQWTDLKIVEWAAGLVVEESSYFAAGIPVV